MSLVEIIRTSIISERKKTLISLTAKELAVLYVLQANQNRGLSISQIEDEMERIFRIPKVKLPNIKMILKMLMEKGWITRRKEPSDKQNKKVYKYYISKPKMILPDILHFLIEIGELEKVKVRKK